MNVVRLRRTTLLKMALVTIAAIVAACLLTLVVRVEPAEATFPGKNGKIAFVARNLEQEGYADIYSVNPDGTGRVQLTDDPPDDTSPDWSPDGTKIAYVHGEAGDLFDPYNYPGAVMVMNADGSGKRKLLEEGSGPAWSPEGTKIAFSRDGDLWTVDAEGSGEDTLLAESPPECGYYMPEWSPDGSRLALTELCEEEAGGELLPFFRVATINADGNGFTRLTDSNQERGGEYFPDWSPDGTKITYGAFSSTGGTSDIWVMNADGSGKTQITFEDEGTTYDGQYYSRSSRSTWSPDGTKIAFAMNTCCGVDLDGIIHVMNPDGTGRAPIIDSATGRPLEGTSPDWGSLATNTAPAITSLRPAPGSTTTDRTPTIAATVTDEQSNLAKSNISLVLDGGTIPRTAFSYNQSTDTMSYTPEKKLKWGTHTVKVVARDGSGLSKTRSWSFEIVHP
jgi:Tol biopolymer transport system component